MNKGRPMPGGDSPTGELDAGNPPVQFGGRGGAHGRHPYPYPLSALRAEPGGGSGCRGRRNPSCPRLTVCWFAGLMDW